MKNIPIEELEKAALEPDDDMYLLQEKLTDVQKFILEIDIKRGSTNVSAAVVYDKYRQWKKTSVRNRISFFMEFTKYFEKRRYNRGIHYLLDSEPFDLSMNKYFEIRRQLRNENEKKQKAKQVTVKNKAKLRELSGTKTEV